MATEHERTATFDDIRLRNENPRLLDQYKQLTWSHFDAVDAEGFSRNVYPGLAVANTSGAQVAMNQWAEGSSISLADGSFDVRSLEITAAAARRLEIDIYGYQDGEVVATKTVIVHDSHPREVHLDWSGVDTVSFNAESLRPPERTGDLDLYFALDDVVFANVRPAPTPSAEAIGAGVFNAGAGHVHDVLAVAAAPHELIHLTHLA